MKKFYFIFFALFSICSNAQIINFPDANFKAKLLSASPNNSVASNTGVYFNSINNSYGSGPKNSIDINENGEIEVSEAILIKYLDVSNSNISDLTGIEFFENLEFLSCMNNQISTLNLMNHSNLEILFCNNNLLNSLDLSQNIFLEYLSMGNNSFSTINLTNNTILKILWCPSNLLSFLDISQNTMLTDLICSNNQLTNLDISQNDSLRDFRCNDNNISYLDLSEKSNLKILFCNNNNISSIDFSDLINLREVYIYNNQIFGSLNFSQNTLVETIWCHQNQISSIDLNQCYMLKKLNCHTNLIDSIDVSNSTQFQYLWCTNNVPLTYINVKNGSSLWTTTYTFQGIDFKIGNNPNLSYVCVDEEEASLIQDKINLAGLSSTCNVNSYCSFTPNGVFYQILGNTKFDFNNDGCDVSDIDFSNLNFSISNGTSSVTYIANETGNYNIPVQSGTITITPNIQNSNYFTISPSSLIIDFPTQTSPYNQFFCVTPSGVHSDVEIVLIPTTPARPGFNAHYRIVYRNIGNQVENGEVKFAYEEDVLDLVSSSLIANSQNTLANTTTLNWNYSNLLPFESRVIDVVLNVNSPTETPAVNNGDVLGIYSEISTTNSDEDLSNNSSSLRQVVVGSYDPNDKTCLEGEYLSSSLVGEYVHYVIRFENTGTYPAENIVVKDMIDVSKFDIATLVPLHGSHDFYTRINGNKVEFIFENINLDFNEATNDGYVAFKIKTLPTLTVGDTFSNEASIYFDYNFPIITNEYVTTINNILGNQDFSFDNEFVLYPNPVKDILNISTKNQTEIQSVEIYNMVGQVVIAIPNSTKTIDVSSLETGTYFIKVNSEKDTTTTKFVKE